MLNIRPETPLGRPRNTAWQNELIPTVIGRAGVYD